MKYSVIYHLRQKTLSERRQSEALLPKAGLSPIFDITHAGSAQAFLCRAPCFFLSLHLFQPVEIIFRLSRNHSAQRQEGDQIRERHQRIKYICNIPYCSNCHIRSDKYCENIQPPISLYNRPVSVEKIFNAPLPIVIPAEDRCKCKEDKTQHKGK